MINHKSIEAFEKSRFGPFYKPLYDSYCFSRIPDTIRSLLGLTAAHRLPSEVGTETEYDTVIFILLDGFGWNLFEKYKNRYSFLRQFVEKGQAHLISSMFPSTTCGHITCLHTGLSGGLSGLYEWYVYDPIVQAPIIPMRFSRCFDKKPNTLLKEGFSPNTLFDFTTFYEMLHAENVSSYVLQPKDVSHSPYSNALQKQAKNIAYKTLREGLKKLFKAVTETQAQKSYFFFYYPEIDSYSHSHGPGSKVLEKELDHCFLQLELFFEQLQNCTSRCALLVGADHGLTNCDPEKRVFINTLVPDLAEYIEQSPNGTPKVPCGSSRDLFLHIRPELLLHAKKLIIEALPNIADVYLTQELIDNGLFGPISQRFLDRVGNLVILPHAPYTVWWQDPRLPSSDFYGHHGGLSHDELAIPLLFLDLKNS